jgi:hypothetical protein
MRRPSLAMMMTAAVIGALLASCTHASGPAGPASHASSPTAAASTSTPGGSAGSTGGTGGTARAGATAFSCDNPIDQVVRPERPQVAVLDAVALDTTTKSLQADDADGNAPHRLFAKTALMVHVGSPAEVDVPARWAKRASVTWGNHAPQWTGQLVIPACPSDGPGGDWLVYPGGVSVDQPSCVPLDVHAGDAVVTVRVSVGAPC